MFFGLFVLFLFLSLHPFTTYPLSLMLLKSWRGGAGPKTQPMAEQAPSFAICMCAYNEAAAIEEKCRNLLALKETRPNLQLLAYVDASTDQTAEILERYAPAITVVVSPDRHGKTHGMNRLVGMAKADILLFTDANVMLDLTVLDRLERYFADPEIGCVCGHLQYTNGADSGTAETGSLYWRLEEKIKQLESDLGSVMGADGSIFAIRRALHHPPPDNIIDDMYVSLMILCDGYRVVRAPDVMAYEEAVASMGAEFQRKIRIACQAFNVHRLLWPRLRRQDWLTLYMYVSHKLLRWLSIYSLGVAGLCFLALCASLGHPMLGLALIALALGPVLLGGRFGVRPFPKILSILTALVGAGIGVYRSLRGERFQVWASTSSLRPVTRS
ncbi:MAG TPA: glycosyltransferase family 2 protein [Aliidongia sp.]|nr:glycosyltransferase family 2 protein [Aliidongia sp.]